MLWKFRQINVHPTRSSQPGVSNFIPSYELDACIKNVNGYFEIAYVSCQSGWSTEFIAPPKLDEWSQLIAKSPDSCLL